MGISSWNNIFVKEILHYLAYNHGHIPCPINVNNILPTVTVDLVIDNVHGVQNDTVM